VFFDNPTDVSQTPRRTWLIEVSKFSTEPVPESQFTLDYKEPGTLVADYTLPEAKHSQGGVTYRIPADPRDLDKAIAEARDFTREAAGAADKRSRLRVVILVANGIAMLVFAAYLVIRYRRASKSQ
jgi:hypothetical protein